MAKIIYLPIEDIDMRYTSHMHADIQKYLTSMNVEHITIPAYTIDDGDCKINNGSFLDAPKTLFRQAFQWQEVLRMVNNGAITSGDVIFTTDIWNIPIIGIPYLNYFMNTDIKLQGVLHAGSFTDTDFVRDMERYYNKFEEIVFDIADKVFVASKFIKDDVIKKRNVNESKFHVTGLPLDYDGMNSQACKAEYIGLPRLNQVVFSGRNVGEKQPHLFEELKKKITDRIPNMHVTYINTHEQNFSKEKYYDCLLQSKVAVSFALQENFGYAMQEASYLGCEVVVPNRLVYPELYGQNSLYNTFDECVDKVCDILRNQNTFVAKNSVNNNHIFSKWFQI